MEENMAQSLQICHLFPGGASLASIAASLSLDGKDPWTRELGGTEQ